MTYPNGGVEGSGPLLPNRLLGSFITSLTPKFLQWQVLIIPLSWLFMINVSLNKILAQKGSFWGKGLVFSNQSMDTPSNKNSLYLCHWRNEKIYIWPLTIRISATDDRNLLRYWGKLLTRFSVAWECNWKEKTFHC